MTALRCALACSSLALALPASPRISARFKFERLAQGYRFTEGPAWSKEAAT